MTETTVKSADDVVQFLIGQHNEIKRLFAEALQPSDGSKRDTAFMDLRRLLAVHETAEEIVVHPLVRRKVAFGDAIVDARLQEEHQAKEHLTKLESLDVDSAEYTNLLSELQSAVLDHAEHEEKEEFAKLSEELDDKQLKRLERAVRTAEAMAPTRPHAGVESAAANVMAGPFAAMLDRARDAIKRASDDESEG
jgi:hemerythrin superfamily protein